jgi:hypothetical protein
MEPRFQSPASIARDILKMYVGVAGAETLESIRNRSTFFSRRILLLDGLAAGNVFLNDLDDQQGLTLQEAFLDAVALRGATGGARDAFVPMYVGDATRLGLPKDRRATLLQSEDQQLDWHFQLLVQAWATAHSQRDVKELKQLDGRFKKVKSCDFAVYKATGRVELSECPAFPHDGPFVH